MKSLFVAWRESDGAGWGPVGQLEYDGSQYRFFYLQGARSLQGFRPFQGMDDLDQVYESTELFPLFANRLFSKMRSEYEAFLGWGGFEPQSSPDPIAILGVTEGIRQTDAVEVFPRPIPDAQGCYFNKFFLHGIRWMGNAAVERISRLLPDEPLQVEPDMENAADRNAVGVHTLEGLKIGYVPRYFAHDVRKLLSGCGVDWIRLFVERVNSDAPLQHRVLCRIQSCWPEGFEPCSGQEFRPIPNNMPVPTRCEP
jgi:hypothetical protein